MNFFEDNHFQPEILSQYGQPNAARSLSRRQVLQDAMPVLCEQLKEGRPSLLVFRNMMAKAADLLVSQAADYPATVLQASARYLDGLDSEVAAVQKISSHPRQVIRIGTLTRQAYETIELEDLAMPGSEQKEDTTIGQGLVINQLAKLYYNQRHDHPTEVPVLPRSQMPLQEQLSYFVE